MEYTGPIKLSIFGKEIILVGYNLWENLAQDIFSNLKPSTLVVISDDNVGEIYLPRLREIFATKSNNFSIVPAGELSKTRETEAYLEDWLFEHQCTRDTVVIALGGGFTFTTLCSFSKESYYYKTNWWGAYFSTIY